MPPFSSQYGGANFDLGGSSLSNFTNTNGSNSSNLGLSGNGPSYSDQFGQNNFTLGEERDKKNNTNKGANVAAGITAGAGALDSVTGLISSLMGNGPANTASNRNYTPPPEKKKADPLLIGGIVGAVLLVIIVLIITKNGKPKS